MNRPRVLLGLLAAALLAGLLLLLRVELEPPVSESIAPDGVCRAPLSRYCTGGCPSYAKLLRSVDEREPLLEAATGTCGPLKWVKWSSGFHGETAYFDGREQLVSLETWKDYPGYCAGTSLSVTYGARPDCQPVKTSTLKQRSSESLAGSP